MLSFPLKEKFPSFTSGDEDRIDSEKVKFESGDLSIGVVCSLPFFCAVLFHSFGAQS